MYSRTILDVEAEAAKIRRQEFLYWQKIAAQQRGFEADGFYITGSDVVRAKAFQMIELHGKIFRAHIVEVPYRIGKWEGDKKARHFQVRLWLSSSENSGRIFQYTQGSGIKTWPRLRDIFQSLLSDAVSGEGNFYNFCDEFGYDRQDREAQKVYEDCLETMDWFVRQGVRVGLLQEWYRLFLDAEMDEENENSLSESSKENGNDYDDVPF